MKYGEKYKTVEERTNAHNHYCCRTGCPTGNDGRHLGCVECAFHWLTIEAEEEKPEPCYGCGRELTERDIAYNAERIGKYSGWSFHCPQCGYRSPYAMSKDEAIAAHNRVACAVKAAKESKNEKREQR